MRVLFGTNVILDVLLARAPHVGPAYGAPGPSGRQDPRWPPRGHDADDDSLSRHQGGGAGTAHRHLRTLLGLFDVAQVTRAVLTDALDLEFPDYEDAVLHEAARHAGAGAIVTREPKGFAKARLKVYAPEELLRFIQATHQS